MLPRGNPRVKRKNVSTETKAEPAKKALKKCDILLQFKALQEKYDILEEENNILIQEKKSDRDAILMLEETIKLLEIQSAKVEKKSVTVQTEIIRCEECEFPAEDMHELVDHMHGSHPLELESEFKCHFEECFVDKKHLMQHRKEYHIEKVKPCSYFIEGKCDFDEECWYLHGSTGSDHGKKEF